MKAIRLLVVLGFTFVVAACGGGGGNSSPPPTTYSISGAVSGLSSASTVMLQNNNKDDLTVTASGDFTFSTKVTSGSSYNISVLTQPSGQTCTVSSGSGTVSGGDVTNVVVTCAANAYSVGGSISGLVGSVGLQINSTTQIFSANGNPTFNFTFTNQIADGSAYAITVVAPPANQGCSVANATGQISSAAVTNVAITCATNTQNIGGKLLGSSTKVNGTVVLQNNGSDDLSVAVTANDAPFKFATTVPVGNTYNVSVFKQPSIGQTCSVAGGSGTTPAADVTSVSVSCAQNTAPRYVFTANKADNSVSTYVMDSAGRLKFISKAATGVGPQSVTVSPSGNYAYVANFTDSTVSQYGIGANGVLTALTPATVTTNGTGTSSVTVDPSGRFAFVTNSSSSTVAKYSVGANGTLTALSLVPAGSSPSSVTVDPFGKYAYVANSISNNVSQYKIDATTGALTAIVAVSPVTGVKPSSITVDPTGKYAYVANATGNTISQYSINAATGALAALTPATVATGLSPSSVTVDPSGKYAYVANATADTVSQYSIGATGLLTALTPATITVSGTNPTPQSVTVDPSGKYAYVANSATNTVAQYSIGNTGALIAIAPATVADAAGVTSVAVSAGAVSPQAIAKYAYVVSTDGIQPYVVGSDGTLASMATVALGSDPRSLAVDPARQYVYVTNAIDNSVKQFSIAADGALTEITAITTGAPVSSIPVSIAIDPSGKFAYVANSTPGVTPIGSVTQYRVGPTGTLAVMTPVTIATGANPTSVAIDPSGKYVYVTYSGTATVAAGISRFSIGTTGTLTSLGVATAVPVGARPSSIAIDPSGKYAYVANETGNTVLQYNIAATGTLTVQAALQATVTAPKSVTVDPSGKFAYVASYTANTVSQYSIGAANGALTLIGGTGVSNPIGSGANPTSVTVDSSGKYVYVSNSTDNSISQYSIGTTGALTEIATPISTGVSPKASITGGTWQ